MVRPDSPLSVGDAVALGRRLWRDLHALAYVQDVGRP
jgi:hypothetical protein